MKHNKISNWNCYLKLRNSGLVVGFLPTVYTTRVGHGNTKSSKLEIMPLWILCTCMFSNIFIFYIEIKAKNKIRYYFVRILNNNTGFPVANNIWVYWKREFGQRLLGAPKSKEWVTIFSVVRWSALTWTMQVTQAR